MASQPFLRKIARDIVGHGGDDWVFDQMADGVTIGKIVEPLGCSRRILYRWRDLEPHREVRRQRWKDAMRESAEARLEKGEEILDELADKNDYPTAPQVSLATARSKYQREIAGVRDPEKFGDRKGATVEVHIGSLHLDALRQHGSPTSLPAPEPEVIEAEVIE